jgi:hypothetical protein
MEDEMQPEYDLKNLRVRKLGTGRKNFCGTLVQLEPDVAAMFPNDRAVNEALRFLIRIIHQNQIQIPEIQSDSELKSTNK